MLGDSLRRRHRGDRDPEDAATEERASGRSPRPGRGGGGRGGRRFPDWVRTPAIGVEWAIAAAVVLIGSFVVGYLLSTQVLFPKPATAGTGISVPDLYGVSRSSAETTIQSAGLVVGEVTELPSRESARGLVLAQDPVPGQELRRGGVVSFAVSQGPPAVRVPPVRGMGVETARELLTALGFEVDTDPLRDASLAPGVVVRSDPAAGTMRDVPSVVTLLVSAGEPGDTLDPGVRPVGEGSPVRGGDTSGARPPSDAGRPD